MYTHRASFPIRTPGPVLPANGCCEWFLYPIRPQSAMLLIFFRLSVGETLGQTLETFWCFGFWNIKLMRVTSPEFLSARQQ